MFAYHEMSARVAKDPAGAATAFKEILDAGGDCSAIAKRYSVTLRTVGRWIARLKTTLGADKLGFTLREGRKPGVPQGPKKRRKASKTGRSKKKSRAAKKAVDN